MSLFWGSSQFDEQVDKATSEFLPIGESDIALNLEICDQIRSKSVTPQLAMRSIKRRVDHKNPNVQLLALELADTCTKNGGDPFLVQIATREFMDDLASIARLSTVNRQVKETILRLVQSWARAWEGKAECSYVGELYKSLRESGFEFPPASPTAATATLYQTATAPTWTDSPVCMRCRTPFSLTNRKHHCRNCGQTFDQACSSKTAPLPHFGINVDVRVCEGCYAKLNKNKKEVVGDKKDGGSGKRESVGSHSWVRKEREHADRDLERAIALSLAEAKNAGHAHAGTPWRPEPVRAPPVDMEAENDPDLAAAIRASLEESQAALASAPSPAPETPRQSDYFPEPPPPLPTYDLTASESAAIIDFSQAVEAGMAPKSMEGLRDRADGLRPKLVRSLDDTERKEQMLSDMHTKLAEVVKLFDHHLNAQLERRVSSPWRQPQRYSTYASYAPAQAAAAQLQPPTNSAYGEYTRLPLQRQQYAAPLPPEQPTPQTYAQPPPVEQQYAPPQQTQYTAPPQAEQPYVPPQQAQYAPPQAQEPYAPEPQREYAPPVAQQQQPQIYAEPARMDYGAPSAQPAYPTSTEMQPSRSPVIAGYMSPPPQQAPASPVMQKSASHALPVAALQTAAPGSSPTTSYNPPLPQQASYTSLPAPPSRQSSYAAPPAPAPPTPFQPAYTPASNPPRQTTLAAPAQPAPYPHHAPYEPQRQHTLPAFPVAPQNVLPSFPIAPTELPNTYARYTPIREEKEVALIEL